MKKNLFLLFAFAIALTSCKKDESVGTPSNPTSESTQKTSNPVLHFTQKVLVEEFVGCSYGDVPNSNYALNNYTMNMGISNTVYVASLHINDIMKINQTVPLLNSFGNGSPISIPCALVNRGAFTGSRLSSWLQYGGRIQQSLTQSASCGLAIASSIRNGHATIDVSTKFGTTLNGQYTVSAYLVREIVTMPGAGYAQANNFNSTPGNPYYGKGNPVQSYTHQHVVIKALDATNGGRVNTMVQIAGGIDTQSFSCDISPSQMGNDCYVIAYITNNATRSVVNTQKVKLGMSKTWD